MKIRTSILIGAILVGVSACTSVSDTAVGGEWLPVLGVPLPAGSGAIAGETGDAEYSWLDLKDIDGDGREDAILTVQRSEASGARCAKILRETVVFRGTGQVGAAFSRSSSVTWFHVQTFIGLYCAKFPDQEVRRQFTLLKRREGWGIRVVESSYQNSAGDSATRGMLLVAQRATEMNLADLGSWLPIMPGQ